MVTQYQLFKADTRFSYPNKLVFSHFAGVGKLLKQAQKMQKLMEGTVKLSEEILEVSGGGGAVSIKITGQGEFKDLKLDQISQEDPSLFLSNFAGGGHAAEQAKKKSDDAMGSLTSGVQMPGFF